ncbi:ABC transporter ATP-binding protein [Elioraea sp. Yellowstone]|jgi:branched-chain amino acid transport system ATP-binding protein|uniref:ABC transporter ATP-binding protein n=1 Tax=Elioraea sp. Yellowstone TaxID=2592070 RepID=UPI0011522B82|nr:ABC transporter ATP-binding protein [Elioraea sp. Yellowstone]TQF83106.1 ABC transporter ATP-binding protein [Elioraea sp. Yellowstone]
MAEPLLQVERLSKRFGALAAVADVSLDLVSGECHAVIGPNGAGKTTLLALIAGEILPDAGRVAFAGEDVTRLKVSRRALRGLGRTFQLTQLCAEFSARRNVMLAVEARVGTPFHFLRRADSLATLAARADAALVMAGLAERAHVPAGLLSHGEQRQLELAVAMAARPRALLLDEPAAGLGPAETAEMAARLAALKGRVAMLLVEHDMDTVFRLADRITVMAEGRVIASGAPDTIRADAAVREAYLGEIADA